MISYQLEFTQAAKADIRHARLWYNNQRENLGNEFLMEIEKIQNNILANPKQFAKVRHHIRKAVLKRFPYNLFFVVIRNNISVIAVFHNSRNPKIWEARMK
ncbi:type II toxin-antitoxin system RelE/ParE family toxin [uncultured Draconibacterium sp.]|uniref:type II toxin-antitoxin system RelE/ParE family toxin n=1 Tax=uncultured Draconibacterium sp. TaxID=1573823 RepID=UPI0032180B22